VLEDGARPSYGESLAPLPKYDWRVNAGLFLLTVLSVFVAGELYVEPSNAESFRELISELIARGTRVWVGWTFALPLLAILLAHEFGHWFAARIHRVPSSLPYFLPLPLISPFGTMGAVIAMPRRIRSRNALLDIGAAGPIAGLVVAIPVLIVGLSLSEVRPHGPSPYWQEGQSILYWALKRAVLGPIPPGHDVFLHPTALAGWAGLLVTMINLLPWGQLDGGHVAYALFGAKQNRYARVLRLALLLLFLYNLVKFLLPVELGQSKMTTGEAITNSLFWLVWFVFLGGIARLSHSDDHPPTDPSTLSKGRRIVAVLTLTLFVLLFMPTPWAVY
jgi:membrane-associated protease RseP (regulator of RpoE activity)